MNKYESKVEPELLEAELIESERHSITRRGLFRAVTALAGGCFFYSLPRVDDGFLAPVSDVLGPTVALGREEDAYFTFDVVALNEVGIQVVDVATPNDKGKPTPVKNIVLTFKSTVDGGGEVRGTTDDDGKMILNLEDIALRNDDHSLLLDRYMCNCEITVDSSKSRTRLRAFSIGLVHIEGGSAYEIGVHKLEKDDTCYVERMSFDDWDVLYTKNTFPRSKENNAEHIVRARFVAQDSLSVRLTAFWNDGKKDHYWVSKEVKTKLDSDSGYQVADFKGYYLQIVGNSPGTPPNKDLWDGNEIELTLVWDTSDGTRRTLKGMLYTEEAPVQGTAYHSPLRPFLTSNGTLGSISLGNADWPCFNNCDISIVNFEFPVHLNVSAYDVMLSFGSDFKMTDKKGNLSADAWKKSQREDIRGAFNKAMSDYKEGLEKFGKAQPFKDKNERDTSKAFAGKFSMKMIAQLVLGVQWDGFKGQGTKVTKTFSGELGVGVGVNAKGSFTWEFMAGPVPCFFTISPSLNVLAALSFICTRELLKDDPIDMDALATADWVPEGSVSLTIKLSLSLALGVGIDGVLAASVSGGASLIMFIGWGETPPEGKDPTRFTVGASFKAEVFLQMICLTVSINVWSHSWNPFYDNWTKASNSFGASSEDVWGGDSQARFKLTQPDGTKRHSVNVMRTESGSYVADGDVFENLKPVTMADMKHSFEASASVGASHSELEDEVLPTMHRNMIPVLVELEDGTLVTRLVECEGVNTFTYEDEVTAEGELSNVVREEEGNEAQEDAVNEEHGAEEQEAEISVEDSESADETVSQDESVSADETISADEPTSTDGPASEDVVADEVSSDESLVEKLLEDAASTEEPGTEELVAASEEDLASDAGLLGLVTLAADEEDAADASEDATAADEDVAIEESDTSGEQLSDGEPSQQAEEEAAAQDESSDDAGSEASEDEDGLGAQEDDSLVGDAYLGFAAPVIPEYDYTPVEGKTTGAICGPGSVSAIAAHDGIKPAVDAVIYQDVFSDPRQRIVDIDGTPHLFRIMTVDYSISGKNLRRPRVVASAFRDGVWGQPTVIEYNSGNTKLLRVDIFDYDFDIVVRSAGMEWTRNVYACLVVTGGLRPNGDKTHADEAFSTPTVSVVLLKKDLSVYQRAVNYVSDLYEDGLAHMLSVPQVCDGFAVGDASGVLAFTYLHRSAPSAGALMTSGAAASFGIGYCYVRDGELSVTINKQPVLIDTQEPVSLDPTVTGIELVAGSGVKGKYDSLVTLLCHKSQGYEVYSAIIPPQGSFAQLEVRRCINSNETLPHIAAWPRHGTFLFTKYRGEDKTTKKEDYYLYAASIDPLQTGQAGFETNCTRVDLNGFRGGNFCVSPTGEYVFYAQTFKDDEDEVNRIMASKYMSTMGGFIEDFPFCELDHSIDGFEVMTFGSDEGVFLVNEITNPDVSLSCLRYVAVPYALVAKVEGFAPLDPFVCAGKPCNFQIDVRNHGNVPIGGFDVTMYDPKNGNRAVDTFTVQTIDPAEMLKSPHSQRDWLDVIEGPQEYHESESADGSNASWRRSMDTGDGEVIMPGELLSYRVVFDIPETWPDDKAGSHEKRVLLRLDNVWSPGIMVDPFKEVVKHLDEGVDGTLDMNPVDASAQLQDPEETIEKKDEPTPGPKPTPSPTPKRPTRNDPLPQTGDPFGAIAPLGLALGGLASLMGAYSARRVEVEREEREHTSHKDKDEE